MPLSLGDYRQKYPRYDSLSDQELADAIYDRYYTDKIAKPDYYAKIGLKRQAAPGSLAARVDNGLSRISYDQVDKGAHSDLLRQGHDEAVNLELSLLRQGRTSEMDPGTFAENLPPALQQGAVQTVKGLGKGIEAAARTAEQGMIPKPRFDGYLLDEADRRTRLDPEERRKAEEVYLKAQGAEKSGAEKKLERTGRVDVKSQPRRDDAILQEYPGLAQYDLAMRRSTDGVDHRGQPYNGRKMEFYPPGEDWSFDAQRPAVEIFDDSVTPRDVMGELYSHYLPRVDPVFKAARNRFMTSISDQQKEQMLRPDYEHQRESGLFEGTFDEWLQGPGGDAFFRGYVTDQYPKDAYTEEQKGLLTGLENKLKSPITPKIPESVYETALEEKKTRFREEQREAARQAIEDNFFGEMPMKALAGARKAGEEISGFAEEMIAKNPQWKRNPALLNRPWTELLADPRTRGAYLARAVGENAPNLVAGMAAGAVGGLAAGPGGAMATAGAFTHLLESGFSFEELEKLAGSPDAAALTAQSVGVMNALLETLPIARMFDKAPMLKRAFIDSNAEAFATEPMLRRALQEGLSQAAVEGGTEALQEVVGNLGKRFYDENQDLFEGVGEAAFIGSLLGGVTGAGGQVITPTKRVPGGEPTADGGTTVPGPELPGEMPVQPNPEPSPVPSPDAVAAPPRLGLPAPDAVTERPVISVTPQGQAFTPEQAGLTSKRMAEERAAAERKAAQTEDRRRAAEKTPDGAERAIRERADEMGYELQDSDYAQAKRALEERLPPNLKDRRLAREDYRVRLNRMAEDDIIKGGDISLLGGDQDIANEGVSRDRETERRRTPSVNPPWFQSLAAGEKVTVEYVQDTVRKALAGEALGVKQRRVVESMLDVISDERQGTPLAFAREELAAARALRKEARSGLPDLSRYDEDADRYAGVLFDDTEYEPAWDAEARALFELADEAAAIDPDATEAILDSSKTDADVARQLWEIIGREQPQQASVEEGAGEPREGAPADETRAAELDDDPLAEEREQFWARREDLKQRFERDGALAGTSRRDPDKTILLTRSMEEGRAPYRVTYFDKGEPTGHAEYGHLDDGGVVDSALREFANFDVDDGDLLELSQQTPEEVKAQERARQEAQKARAEEERRAEADAQRDSFTLTGSDSEADQAAAAGQQDLLAAQPTRPPSDDEQAPDEDAADAEIGALLDEIERGEKGNAELIPARGEAGVKQAAAVLRARGWEEGKRGKGTVWRKGGTELFTRSQGDDAGVIVQWTQNVDTAAAQAATSPKNDLPAPTEAQKEAGNYQKGHARVAGLDISIENPAGTKRRPEWPTLKSHYGYIKRTDGADGEHIDVFVKPGTPEDYDGPVFVVDQASADGTFDEHKVMLGFPDEAAARAAYLENYTKGWNGIAAITRLPISDFATWARDAKAGKKPLSPDAAQKPTTPGGFKQVGSATWAKSIDGEGKRTLYNVRMFGDPRKYRLTKSVSFPGTGVTGAPSQTVGDFDSLEAAIAAADEQPAAPRQEAPPAAPAAEPAPAPKAPDPEDGIYGMVESGERLFSDSGRALAPVPKIDTTTERKLQNSIRRLDGWLLDEAKKEAPDDYQRTLLEAIDLKNISQSDRDTLNYILFGSEEGPKARHRQPPTPKPDAEAPKATPKAKRADGYGKSNKVFTEDKAAAARERLRKKLGTLKAGLDPEDLVDGVTLAGYHIEAGAREFAAFARAMASDLGDAIAPYLKSLYEMTRTWPGNDPTGMTPQAEVADADVSAILAEEGPTDVPDPGDNVEPDRADGGTEVPRDGAAVPDDAGRADRRARGAGNAARRARDQQQGDPRISDRNAAAARERGDQPVYRQDGLFAEDAARSDDDRGSAESRPAGVQDDAAATARVEAAARGTASGLDEKRAAQRAASKRPVTLADPANIEKTVPFLLEGQREDVLKAERRFQTGGAGMLFTNGTGTGKTYTALGIVARHIRATGDDNVLIVVPSQPKVTDWIEDGRNLDVPISKLDSKKDAGKGVVVTTYANFRDNWSLVDRDFSLIVYDESHYLKLSEKSEALSFDQHRAVAHHPGGLYTLAYRRDPKARALEMQRRKWLLDVTKAAQKFRDAKQPPDPAKLSGADAFAAQNLTRDDDDIKKLANKQFQDDNQEALYAAHDRAREAAEMLPERYPRPTNVVFLSASPFPYHFSLDYAEGFLFDYGTKDSTSYNAPDGRDSFYMGNLGYRKRYNKLTKPDAEVDQQLMERQLAERLKKEGVMSGRMLDTGFDYSRQFIRFSDELGTKIDRGFKVLQGYRENEETGEWESDDRYKIIPSVMHRKFTHIYLSQLREGIAARHLKDRIDKHLALGRKVVLFHDYRKGIDRHPFDLSDLPSPRAFDDAQQMAMMIQLDEEKETFGKEHPDLVALPLTGLSDVVTTIEREYGDRAAFINGTVSPKQKDEAKAAFNDDGSGIDIIVVQRQSGREGISLHDTTGKKQRVLLDMGLPIAPVDAIQTEGRINRFGVKSNAIVEYAVLQTSFERSSFFSKVSERASTAENLAMGQLARGLRQAFRDGYQEFTEDAPSAEQGTGGMEIDRSLAQDSPFQIAKGLYFGTLSQKGKRRDQRAGMDYYPTPEPLGLKMVEWSGAKPGDDVLEPSAGHGAIARFFPENARVTAIEPSYELHDQLQAYVDGRLIRSDFESHHITNKYDAIAMNPPFGSGGSLAVKHLDKATQHLRNGGRVVALIPTGPAADKAFDKWYEGVENVYMRAEYVLPRVTFERAGTQIASRVVVLDKFVPDAKLKDAERARAITDALPSQPRRREISADNIKEFFDAIEEIEAPERVRMPEAPAEETTAPQRAEIPADTGVQIEEATHTRTGDTIWYGRMGRRVEREEYLAIKEIAKKHGGYWSSFKGNGLKPGFIFKTGEDAQAFAQEVNQGPLASRGAPAQGGMKAADVAAIKADVTEGVGARYSIDVVQSESDLPAWVPKPAPGVRPRGIYYRGRVWLIADNIENKRTAATAVAHEVFGHLGPEAAIDNWPEVEATINGLIAEGNARAVEIANEITGTETMPGRYPDALPGSPVFVREFIALAAERKHSGPIAKLLSRIRAAIRRFLKAVGLKRYFEDAEIDVILRNGEVFLRADGAKTASGAERTLASQREDRRGVWFSALHRAILNAPQDKASAEQWRAYFKKAGVREEELKWLEIDEFLDDAAGHLKSIPRDDVAEYVEANSVRVDEVVYGGLGYPQAALDEMARTLGYAEPYDALGPNDQAEVLEELSTDDRYFGGDGTRYHEYQLPGGENYRELLITLPGASEHPQMARFRELDARYDLSEAETEEYNRLGQEIYPGGRPRPMEGVATRETDGYRSAHWTEPNILAHIRFNERTDADGKRVLFIEEIQSDWHQAGRQGAYAKRTKSGKPYAVFDTRGREGFIAEFDTAQEAQDYIQAQTSGRLFLDYDRIDVYNDRQGAVPDAPFKQSWPLLAFKRALRWAVENGFDRVAWTTGQQQAERYQQTITRIRKVEWGEVGDTKAVIAYVDRGMDISMRVLADGQIANSDMPRLEGKLLSDVLGKEIAERVMNERDGSLPAGGDVVIGGEGMRGFYDKILPAAVNKYAKKWGGKVRDSSINTIQGSAGGFTEFIQWMSDKGHPESAMDQWRDEGPRLAEFMSEIEGRPVNVHALDIAPQMRESVLQGQPLFMRSRNPDDRGVDSNRERENDTAGRDRGILDRQGRAGVPDPSVETGRPVAGKPAVDARPVQAEAGVGDYAQRATLSGNTGRPDWALQTRASTGAGPTRVFRGAQRPLRVADFDRRSLGFNTSSPTSGLGVYFTSSETEAGSYGPSKTAAYLDIRNPFILPHYSLPEFESVDHAYAWRKLLQQQGFDGLILEESDVGANQHFVVFEPDQVLPLEQDGLKWDEPLYSRAAPPKQGELFNDGFDFPSETLFDYVARNMQDRFRRVKLLQRAITEAGGRVDEASDAYLGEELFHGRVAEALGDFRAEYVDPLVEQMAGHEVTMDELDDYLYARHARERNEYIASIREDMPDGGSGMTNAEADQVLASYADRADVMEDLAERVDAINRARIAVLEAAGLEHPDVLDLWRQRWQHYVPLRGWTDEHEQLVSGRGRGFDIRGKESKQALGRRSKADSPLLYTIAQMEVSLIRAEKNRVGQKFLQLALDNPNPRLWTVSTSSWGDYKPVFDRQRGEVVYRRDPRSKYADNVLSVKKDGKEYLITFEDEGNLLARALKNMGPDQANVVIRFMAGFNRYMAAINTSLNPEFVLSNFARDLQTAIINLVGEQDAKGALREPKKIARKVLKDMPKAARGVFDGMYGRNEDAEWTQWYHEFRRAGGKITFYSMADLEQQRTQIRAALAESQGGVKGSTLHAVNAIGRHMQNINGVVENMIRLSTYVQARRAGLSQARAASLARNLTVNFTRKGEFGNVANALYLFFNAALQGSVRLLYAVGRSRRVQAIMGGLIVTSFLWAMLNRWMGGEDDDGEDAYDKQPNYVKTRNIVFMRPDGSAWKVPLPYGYNVPWVLGTYLERAMFSKRGSFMEGGVVLAQAVLESFNPLGSADSEEAFNWLMKVASPTITDPLVELGLNEDFAGRPIRKEQPPWGPPLPDHQLHWNGVSWASKTITKTVNDVLGGDEFEPGAIDVNPETLDYLFSFFTGGAGRAVGSIFNVPIKAFSEEEDLETRDIPFYRRVRQDAPKYYTSNRYYDIKDEIELLRKRSKAYEETGNQEGARRMRKESGKLLDLYPELRRAERQLRRLYKEQREARAALEGQAKMQAEKRIEEAIEAQQQELIRVYNQVAD